MPATAACGSADESDPVFPRKRPCASTAGRTPSHSVDIPAYSATWPCEPRTAGLARGLVRAALHTWELDGLVDRATLITSELVSNSVQHSGGRLLRVGIALPEREVVRLSVSDRSTAHPVPCPPDLRSEHGRGLLLVEALADSWETDIRAWGKVIRAELRTRNTRA
ncbi:ATP-binding protein [Streptomyces sp. GSL17-111]|uniref:ATP-binding protein n=1 Tax=Streptomyces sp. GSL17-111 TaxID=3121596 RepID=UPI0030F3775D